MPVEWKTILIFTGIFALCFLGIPIKVDAPKKEALEQQMQDRNFQEFMQRYNRPYYNKNDTSEYEGKLKAFQNSIVRAKELNSTRLHYASAIYGVTKFSDLTPEEFLHKHLSPSLSKHIKKHRLMKKLKKKKIKRAVAVPKVKVDVNTLPAKVDWREKNIITRIKNQATCGACWAFCVVETIESMYANKTGKLVELSVQESIDCSEYNKGCDGGDTCNLLEWMTEDNIGILSEYEYPFIGREDHCKYKNTSKIRIETYTCSDFTEDENEILKVLANHGPVAVAVNAINWQNYIGGIIQFHCNGTVDQLNHAVQIIGYDRTAPIPHYIIRNSWGTDFGDNGYIYVEIGSNLCGLANEVSSLTVLT